MYHKPYSQTLSETIYKKTVPVVCLFHEMDDMADGQYYAPRALLKAVNDLTKELVKEKYCTPHKVKAYKEFCETLDQIQAEILDRADVNFK